MVGRVHIMPSKRSLSVTFWDIFTQRGALEAPGLALLLVPGVATPGAQLSPRPRRVPALSSAVHVVCRAARDKCACFWVNCGLRFSVTAGGMLGLVRDCTVPFPILTRRVSPPGPPSWPALALPSLYFSSGARCGSLCRTCAFS